MLILFTRVSPYLSSNNKSFVSLSCGRLRCGQTRVGKSIVDPTGRFKPRGCSRSTRIRNGEPVFEIQETPLKECITYLCYLVGGDEQNRDTGVSEPRRSPHCGR